MKDGRQEGKRVWKTGAIVQGYAMQAELVVFEVVRGCQGLVSAGDNRNVPGGKPLPERVAHTLLPKTKS